MVSSNVTDKYSQFHIDLYLLHFHSFIIQFTRSHLLIFRHSVSQMKPGIYKNIGSLRQVIPTSFFESYPTKVGLTLDGCYKPTNEDLKNFLSWERIQFLES